MIQRCLASRTRSRSLVLAGRVESQYLVGSASARGHSISSHSSGWGWLRQSSRCAGRTRIAAKRERKGCRVPSRQVTVLHARGGKEKANSFAESGTWCRSRRRSLGGRPVPFQAGLGKGPVPAFHTLIEDCTPSTYRKPNSRIASRNLLSLP